MPAVSNSLRMANTTGDRGAGGTTFHPIARVRTAVEYIPAGDTIPRDEWQRRHRSILVATLVHVPFLTAFGLYRGAEPITGATFPATPLWVIAVGQGITVAVTVLAYPDWFSRRVRTALATTGLVATSVTLVQYSGGFIEAHFHFFVVLGVFALYEDWLPFVLGIGYVGLSHGVFGMIDGSLVYNHAPAIENPWVWGLIHAGFVSGLALALITNWISTEKSRETATQRLERAREKEAEVRELQKQQAESRAELEQLQERQAETEDREREVRQAKTRLEETAASYSEVMSRAADGDLTVRMDGDVESDAMSRVAVAFNDMMDDIEAAIHDVQEFSDEVVAEGEAADTAAAEAESTSEEISASVAEIDESTTRQREMLADAAAEVTDLSAAVEEVAASAETVAERSTETASVAEDGEATAERAIETAREAQASVDEAVDTAEALSGQMAEIGEIVDLIGDVAEQTNMLALNANIEAARADAGGDGFAVVADEVKQLAEETRESATEIAGLIDETQSRTETTVEEVQRAEQYMQETVETVEGAAEAFATVSRNAEETDSGIQEISATTDDQAATAENAATTIERAAESSERTATETGDLASAAERQADSAARVCGSVGTVTARAEELRALLNDFTTAPAPDTGGRRDPGTVGPAGTGDGGGR
jgi:methyl-accepting chemotaxis protein